MSIWRYASSRATHAAPAASLGTAACLLCLWLLASTAFSAPGRGRAARVVSVNDVAHLSLANPNGGGGTLVEEGRATGTLPGTVRARLTVGASTVRLGFTIYLHGGSISGQGTAKLTAGRGEYASFSGSLTVNHGSSHYAHASGSGGLYGTINRYSDNAVVQVIGRLHL